MCPCIVADGLTKELGRMKADPTVYTAEFYGDVEGFPCQARPKLKTRRTAKDEGGQAKSLKRNDGPGQFKLK
ncbi:hypothetical protein I305_00002 [Cryptococcus gattii E566]|uniref:Uncharacterized protein n=2 Tax=Cryptococcus gattii TaxID=37769 RepID=E6RFQ2_CRYGW|nr:Hypothetical Protein CGB_N3540C [Cryptococcus gattii WM276]ADV25832.1 Hypothetical Protein CGB_N3540C [Cryptococcus gattii WM276]KIR77978.1 hypothetical protein I306_05021 [Cryptococcus gattii EJB2]KIY36914.1 hypothetical protein I305_00002 [Cryptococcus gattii E566]KJE00616.1 hypothetical protein I311_05811 [Cryptococcus gattii NT-10]